MRSFTTLDQMTRRANETLPPTVVSDPLEEEDREYIRLKNQRTIAALLARRGLPMPPHFAFE